MDLQYQIINSMDSMEWFLMFLGWLMYWLKGLDDLRKENKIFNLDTVQEFFMQKIFEIPLSAISLVVVALLSSEIPATLIDLNGKISLFLAGYASSSILNGLLSYRKKTN